MDIDDAILTALLNGTYLCLQSSSKNIFRERADYCFSSSHYPKCVLPQNFLMYFFHHSKCDTLIIFAVTFHEKYELIGYSNNLQQHFRSNNEAISSTSANITVEQTGLSSCKDIITNAQVA